MDTDHKYEFDCPQFIDFNSIINEEDADEWFESKGSQLDVATNKENDGCWSPIAKPSRKVAKPRLGITIPVTPNLETKKRCRPVTVLSQKDLEDKEVNEMKKYHFRARPFKAALVTTNKTTESSSSVEMPLASVKRKMNAPNCENKRPRLPYVGIPVIRDESGNLVPKPFPFEETDKARKERKAAKIREILEKEKAMREFKALPAPSFSVKPVVSKSAKPATSIEPFQLESLLRHESYKEMWQRKMKDEELLAKKAALFVAKPCTVTCASPFVPERSSKPLTAPYADLHSERRAVERREFDDRMKQKEEERLALEKEREEWRRRDQEIEIAELRASLIHKPLPVPSFTPPRIARSSRELTLPRSPALGVKPKTKISFNSDAKSE